MLGHARLPFHNVVAFDSVAALFRVWRIWDLNVDRQSSKCNLRVSWLASGCPRKCWIVLEIRLQVLSSVFLRFGYSHVVFSKRCKLADTRSVVK